QLFSSEKEPTLWRAIPALEHLLSAWEKKKDPRFAIYVDALDAGLNKIMKYYLFLDQKPAFVLALLLHPYFKLNYIEMAWGGAKEQEAERRAGNTNAKNWQDEALKIVENTMRKYWSERPQAAAPQEPVTMLSTSTQDADDFDLHRQALLTRDDEGWQAELQ
ncbi:hypothetical protein DXG01_009264, partial [Tephrocybe rancida]